ncbi:hypothetical protein MAM1_0172d07203 [Mucor ambiguus]|uniref:Uncharacterized protein n=1 Tax=Mucor ambiguus TaxID=91626 RepID=A0A0C9MAX1_9FUNG|nr:hypothetical protein MAM1_0172d07203 [Mucor ambiguus]
MSNLLLDNEANNTSKILERSGLIDEEDTKKDPFVDELKKSIQESTADMPLGKALHLLLNVHGQVFERAVSCILKNSTAAEIAIKTAESPTVKAILSIQNYVSKDASALFKQIYDSLKDKFLKKQPNEAAMRVISYFILHSSTCKIQAQQVLIDELKSADKKDQLAVVVLLQFLMKHYSSSMNRVALVFFNPLAQLVEMRSSQPTLLNCLACELALRCIQMALTASPDTLTSKTSSTKIMEVEETEFMDTSEEIWQGLENILHVLETWQKSKSCIESAAYKELYKMAQDKDTAAWRALVKYITPKKLLSDKPLTLKRQKQILSDAEISSSTQLLILALLQKGQWIELYGDNRGSVIASTEQDAIKSIIQEKFKSSMQLKRLVPQLVMALPRLFSCSEITDTKVIQSITDQVVDSSDEMIHRLTPMLMNQPESSICYLLMHIAQQDTHSQFAYAMLTHLIYNQTDQTVAILQDNLLSLVKQSNQACELLIKCMEFADLPVLIRKLMKMSIVEDEKEKMTCIALISKALLQERWASSSVLNYIEMVRDFKLHKGFTVPNSTSYLQGPQDIASSNLPVAEVSEVFEPDQVQTISISLLLPLQLWSARVSEGDFGSALRQLVQYCCGIPKDGTWIEAWKQFSFAFAKKHQLVWHAVEECTHVLASQTSMTQDVVHDTSIQAMQWKESIVFLRISPMLILQTIPKDVFDVLKLPNSYVNLITHKLEKIGVSRDMIKTSQQQDAHAPVCIQLMDELLQRNMATTKSLGAKIYSISGIHRSTNAMKLESKMLAKRVAVGGIPADASIHVEPESFGDDLTVIPHARILLKADSTTGTADDTAQQPASDSTDSNVSSDDSSSSPDSKSNKSSDSATMADDSSASTVTKDGSQKTTKAKENSNAMTTDDQTSDALTVRAVATSAQDDSATNAQENQATTSAQNDNTQTSVNADKTSANDQVASTTTADPTTKSSTKQQSTSSEDPIMTTSSEEKQTSTTKEAVVSSSEQPSTTPTATTEAPSSTTTEAITSTTRSSERTTTTSAAVEPTSSSIEPSSSTEPAKTTSAAPVPTSSSAEPSSSDPTTTATTTAPTTSSSAEPTTSSTTVVPIVTSSSEPPSATTTTSSVAPTASSSSSAITSAVESSTIVSTSSLVPSSTTTTTTSSALPSSSTIVSSSMTTGSLVSSSIAISSSLIPSSIISSSSISSTTSLVPSMTSAASSSGTSSAQATSATSAAQASPSATDLPMNNAEPSSSINKGAIAGGVVGGVCGAALLVALFFWLFRRSRRNKSQMQKSGTNDMFQYSPENGGSNWGDAANATTGAAAGAAVGARAFVPPADTHSTPYTDDYPPTTPHSATHNNDDNYYYSPTNANGYQHDGDYYNTPNAAAAGGGGYYNYTDGSQMGSEPYSDQHYYSEGYSDATAAGMAGATGMAAAGAYGAHGAYGSDKLADASDKTFMHAGESSDPRQVFSKPDAREE